MNGFAGHLPRMYKTLGSRLSTAEERKREKEVGMETETETDIEIITSLFLYFKVTHQRVPRLL